VAACLPYLISGASSFLCERPGPTFRMSGQRPPPNLPPAEEAIPIEPAVAKARATFVRHCIDKIVSMKTERKTEDEIHNEVGSFVNQYPTLFKMVMKPDGEKNPSLKTMLTMLERMGSGDLTQHQASVIVGQRLHDTYIKPKLDQLGEH